MDLLTADEAAARLGVKKETLYAYVSRGLLTSERVAGRKGSRFLRADVERLAGRAREPRTGGRDLVIDSALTLLDPTGRLYYRGREVTGLAQAWSFEQAAEWLWSANDGGKPRWDAPTSALRLGRSVGSSLPASASITDRMRVSVAAMAITDPLRHDRRPAAVMATGRALIAALVASLPLVGAEPPPDAGIARTLWSRLAPGAPRPAQVRALDTALVLLADHEVPASTLAARVAASTWADPFMVVLAGLAALDGPLHGGASSEVRDLLREVIGGRPPEEAIGAIHRAGGHVPGFGHAVYEGGDPRAVALLGAVARTRPPRDLTRAVEGLIEVTSERNGPAPNVDFALAAFIEAAAMVDDAGEAIFGVARCAGWVAHAIEEYEHRLRYRPRAAYTGPRPT